MVTLNLVLLIIALTLFVLAALNIAVSKINVLAAGLAFWVAAVLVSSLR
jgi:hypothetical protein